MIKAFLRVWIIYRELGRVCGGKIDLEWAPNGLLISEALEETGVVLHTSADQVHRVSVGCTELDVLAAVKECMSKVSQHGNQQT